MVPIILFIFSFCPQLYRLKIEMNVGLANVCNSGWAKNQSLNATDLKSLYSDGTAFEKEAAFPCVTWNGFQYVHDQSPKWNQLQIELSDPTFFCKSKNTAISGSNTCYISIVSTFCINTPETTSRELQWYSFIHSFIHPSIHPFISVTIEQQNSDCEL